MRRSSRSACSGVGTVLLQCRGHLVEVRSARGLDEYDVPGGKVVPQPLDGRCVVGNEHGFVSGALGEWASELADRNHDVGAFNGVLAYTAVLGLRVGPQLAHHTEHGDAPGAVDHREGV